MAEFTTSLHRLVDHLFRHEAGKLVATLTRFFGPSHLELAEDVVQDTLIAAMDSWSDGGIPQNPAAWLTKVAKRKAINALNRNKTGLKHQEEWMALNQSDPQNIDTVFLEKEIRDSQLRMIFTCCHPHLSLESQIALTLKTLGGFSVNEVARALFSNNTTINKRLYRAKEKIRSGEIPFDIPAGDDLAPRLDAVGHTLYLLFNEGYHSSHPELLIRKDLCLEAIRLLRLLLEHFDHPPKLCALMALMCFHSARLESRLDKEGAIVIFEEQNRALWDQNLIGRGMQYLKLAAKGEILSEYHLEAGIAAEHALAANFEQTNWNGLKEQYELLYALQKNPVILLNLAIVSAYLDGKTAALEKLMELRKQKVLEHYYLLPATIGVFSMQLGQYEEACDYFLEARQLTSSETEIRFLDLQLQKCTTASDKDQAKK